MKIKTFFLKTAVFISAIISVTTFLFLVGYILVKGLPNLSADLFSLNYNSENVSLFPALINTIIITVLALLVAIPLGIGAAIYLVEYSKKESKFVKIVRLATETLAGIPSIIFGLFGMIFFSITLKFGISILAGSLTLSIMVIPLIMRTTEEALICVPSSYREGSLGLGAGKLRTIIKIVLPSAIPGIVSGIILATGRIIGETAALIYTAGSVAQIPENLFNSARTLSVHLYVLSSEGLYINQTYATAVILLIVVIAINTFSSWIAKKIGGNK